MDTRDQRMIDFIQTLKIPEGMYQGQQFILRPFQQEIIRSVYGDLDENGLRITRKGIFSVAKKNGKTPLIAGLALGHLVGRYLFEYSIDNGATRYKVRYHGKQYDNP